jgi:hypothetical protein
VSWVDVIPPDPVSDDYGFSLGTPLDRWYIERFLAAHSDAIAGSVLEVQDSLYTTRFGGHRVSASAILDVVPSNKAATVIADLAARGSLSDSRYDCIILTQTLHLLADPGACVENCWSALRPGGALLVTASALSRVSPTYPDSDYWRFAPAGIRRLFETHWTGRFSISSFGNLRTCIGFLLAQTVEETPKDVFDTDDPRYPLTVAVNAEKA